MSIRNLFAGANRLEIKEIMHLAWPVVVSQVGHILFAFFDTIMIGPLGQEYLAAASVANGVFFLIMVFGLGLTFVLSPLTSEKLGARQPGRAPVVLTAGFYVAIPASMLSFAVIWGLADLFAWMNLPAEVVPLAASYLKILAWSVIPLYLFQIVRQYVDGLGFTRPSMIVTWIGLVLNIVANYALIYGAWGFPALKLDGAGWATFLSRVVMALLMVATLPLLPSLRAYLPLIRHWVPSREVMRKILSVGLPSGAQYFFEVAAFTFASIMCGWIGTAAMASHQVAINLASMTYMVATGFSAAGSIRVGYYLGRNDRAMQRIAGFQVLVFTGLMMAGFGLLFILLHPWLPMMYTPDQAVIHTASMLLLIAAVFQISDGVQAVGLGILRAVQDSAVPTAITILAYWVIGIPVGAITAFWLDWGVYGLWAGLSLGLAMSAILLSWRFHRLTR
ncbi:MAG: MATE family efflux transporter [Bacteroidetes bacterium]|nr:MATE family efflux transporter [Bacteroidota bacterium]